MRERITAALKDAMKSQDATRTSTLRLIQAALKDRDIAARAAAEDDGTVAPPPTDTIAVLSKMVSQRQESARAYEEAGRLELAERERDEIDVIREFLPTPMSREESDAAIAAAIDETGASSIRDMKRVMAELKSRHPGRMDFARAGAEVKARLA